MEFSSDTEAVLKFLDEASDNSLRKRQDIGTILETGATFNLVEQINKIIFSGASLWNIANTIKRGSPDTDKEKLKSELHVQMDELIAYLKEIIKLTNEETQSRFETIYFLNNRGTTLNIIDLAHDLAGFKKLQKILQKK